MKAFLPKNTIKAQEEASNPASSVWVSANAGSGKTHILSQRVIRLLLQGTNPSKILCITYTRLAAANMSNRIFQELSKWAMAPKEELIQEIEKIEGKKPNKEHIQKARQLFARALEAPGGLKIQTIHAFCESILHRFPLEANIKAHFELIGEEQEKALIKKARKDMISGRLKEKSFPLKEAFALVLSEGGEHSLDEILNEIILKRENLRILIDAVRSLAKSKAKPFHAFLEEFGFSDTETEEEIALSLWPLPDFPWDYFNLFYQQAEKTEARKVLKDSIPSIKEAFSEKTPIRRLELLVQGFLKKDGTLYDESFFKSALRESMPDLIERYQKSAIHIQNIHSRLNLFRTLQKTIAVLTIADFLIGRYEDIKRSQGLLDFNDLISRTLTLFAREDTNLWVRYKLDDRIDHILVDEAQDTSPAQWNVIKALASEFFIGERSYRTVFAVGDEKQSIYSFQGASPNGFTKMRNEFSNLAAQGGRSFKEVNMIYSFRSTQDILSAVDRVFSSQEKICALTSAYKKLEHHSIRKNSPGYVELWDSLGEEEFEEPKEWYVSARKTNSPADILADKISNTIAHWIRSGEKHPESKKPITYGDILILVRKRDAFIPALSRHLKQKNIHVAGADRLKLTSHIAVQDLIALGSFILQPDDDLSLACLLKSPLLGIEESLLFEFAAQRNNSVSLFDSIAQDSLKENSKGKTAKALIYQLQFWMKEATFESPFEFYSHVLQRDGGRKKMIQRLGTEVEEVLDEFLDFCLVQERNGSLSLQKLLFCLESIEPEIKREMENGRDEIRIMTVHAAKGLEASIVFLVDCGSDPCPTKYIPNILPFQTGRNLKNVSSYLWEPKEKKNNFMGDVVRKVKEGIEEEYNRLLYVGMTRAKDRLIICGYHGKTKPSEKTWHSIIRNTLEASSEVEKVSHCVTGEDIVRFSITHPLIIPEIDKKTYGEKNLSLPIQKKWPPLACLKQKLLTPAYSPSKGDKGDSFKAESIGKIEKKNIQKIDLKANKGKIIHRMLQILPDLAVPHRKATAMRIADGIEEKEKEEIWKSVDSILESSDYSFLFSGESRTEVPIAGTLTIKGKAQLVSGRIDRICLEKNEIWIVDYKTSSFFSPCLKKVPHAFIEQLGLYALLLEKAYQEKKIRTGILFTQQPHFLEIPEEKWRALF